jgi:aminopeptidase YwaD
MLLAPAMLLAAAFGEAALGHARALAALGPHPWGSPRARAAAEYVAVKFRDAGLAEVRLQEFESHGLGGANVIGVLRAAGPEFVVVGAHHDTAPDAPGAYDDGGGVGVLIETARALARAPSRPRTLVFVSWDAEEAESQKPTSAAGSREYVRSLGAEARNLVAALDIEMCGWKGGTPVLHPIAYADALRPGQSVIAPGWLVSAVQSGARQAGAPLRVGDPLLSWLYQPAVRTFRVRLYGDDLSFLQEGLPAVFLSDSSFTAYYPWYHRREDTADKIDAASLARVGEAVLGAVQALSRVTRGGDERDWVSVLGYVLGRWTLLALGILSLAPGLSRAFRTGGAPLAARALHAGLFGTLLWRHCVPALWVFALPNVVSAMTRRAWSWGLALAPLVALAGIGVAARLREAGPAGAIVSGTWLSTWEFVAAAAALALLFVRPAGAAAAPRPRVRVSRRSR